MCTVSRYRDLYDTVQMRRCALQTLCIMDLKSTVRYSMPSAECEKDLTRRPGGYGDSGLYCVQST